jgi:hypothetical protein
MENLLEQLKKIQLEAPIRTLVLRQPVGRLAEAMIYISVGRC